MREEYEKAEECLAFFSKQNPERKRKMAEIYSLTGRRAEAYKAYEELLFSGYQMVNGYFSGLYKLAVEDGDRQKAHMVADRIKGLARVFDMGAYHEAWAELDLAVMEKDSGMAAAALENMFGRVDEIESWRRSSLYEHMTFRELGEKFWGELKQKVIAGLGGPTGTATNRKTGKE